MSHPFIYNISQKLQNNRIWLDFPAKFGDNTSKSFEIVFEDGKYTVDALNLAICNEMNKLGLYVQGYTMKNYMTTPLYFFLLRENVTRHTVELNFYNVGPRADYKLLENSTWTFLKLEDQRTMTVTFEDNLAKLLGIEAKTYGNEKVDPTRYLLIKGNEMHNMWDRYTCA